MTSLMAGRFFRQWYDAEYGKSTLGNLLNWSQFQLHPKQDEQMGMNYHNSLWFNSKANYILNYGMDQVAPAHQALHLSVTSRQSS